MINSWKINDDEYLFFDIFHKNNMLILICPVYNDGIDINQLYISCEDERLALYEKISEINYEPTEILKYSCQTAKSINRFIIKYNNIVKEFNLENLHSTSDNSVALTTLFKNDSHLINIFYDYYIRQGVTHFYLYYNGIASKDIIERCNLPGILLIDWNFKYWNTNKKFVHHAQMGQINHALYRFGKEIHKYMIFCDFDEYLYIPGKVLANYFTEKEEIDVFGFCNCWSNTLDNNIPDKFPNTFLTSTIYSFGGLYRSKCVYKVASVVTCSIHSWKKITGQTKDLDNTMYHFYNWANPDRKIPPTSPWIGINTTPEVNKEVTIVLPL